VFTKGKTGGNECALHFGFLDVTSKMKSFSILNFWRHLFAVHMHLILEAAAIKICIDLSIEAQTALGVD